MEQPHNHETGLTFSLNQDEQYARPAVIAGKEKNSTKKHALSTSCDAARWRDRGMECSKERLVQRER